MSCEERARGLGVELIRTDKTGDRDALGRRLRYFEFGFAIERARRERSLLRVKWHTRAGAWQAAYRWAKKECGLT